MKTIARMIPPGLYHGLIWTLSSISININITGLDKTAHIIEYSGLGFLMSLGLGVNSENFETKAKYCLILSVIIGILDESHQYFVPGRSMDFYDLLADLTGISAGILCWLALSRLLSFVKTNKSSKTL